MSKLEQRWITTDKRSFVNKNIAEDWQNSLNKKRVDRAIEGLAALGVSLDFEGYDIENASEAETFFEVLINNPALFSILERGIENYN